MFRGQVLAGRAAQAPEPLRPRGGRPGGELHAQGPGLRAPQAQANSWSAGKAPHQDPSQPPPLRPGPVSRPDPPGRALTAERGCPPVPGPPAGVGALAGELGEGAAHAGGAGRALAAVLGTGLHVGLQRHQVQAALEGLGRQQPLALGALRAGRLSVGGGPAAPTSLPTYGTGKGQGGRGTGGGAALPSGVLGWSQ